MFNNLNLFMGMMGRRPGGSPAIIPDITLLGGTIKAGEPFVIFSETGGLLGMNVVLIDNVPATVTDNSDDNYLYATAPNDGLMHTGTHSIEIYYDETIIVYNPSTPDITTLGGTLKDGQPAQIYYDSGGLSESTRVFLDGVELSVVSVADEFHIVVMSPLTGFMHSDLHSIEIQP